MTGRPDISDWLIHFVHDRNPILDDSMYDDIDEPRPAFRFTDGEPEGIEYSWRLSDAEYVIEPDAYAIQVVEKILHDGHIRAGWSWRESRSKGLVPTIYGESPAVCMTEMPLSSLLAYAKNRAKSQAVLAYGIALKKDEVFQAGGRQVIYGLSGNHREISDVPRLLDPACGIGKQEQYRYVATSLGSERPIDWTHEREWRWAHPPGLEIPGLSLWLDDEPTWSSIIVIVSSDDEAEDMLAFIRKLADRRSTNYEHQYCVEQIERVRVLSLARIERLLQDNDVVRIDDIPLALKTKFGRVAIDQTDRDRANAAITDLNKLIPGFQQEYLDATGGSFDLCGFAHVSFDVADNPFCEALIQERKAETWYDGYRVILPISGKTQNISEEEFIAQRCADYLNDLVGERHFWMKSRLD